MICVLCESGHVGHAHLVGVEAICSVCKKPGTVVATCMTDYDSELDKTVRMAALEESAYAPPGLTCRDCEAARFKNALPVRGVCPACGKGRPDTGFFESFCNDACRGAWLGKEARDVG